MRRTVWQVLAEIRCIDYSPEVAAEVMKVINLADHSSEYSPIHDRIAIEKHKFIHNGDEVIAVRIYNRDCDLHESTSVRLLPADWKVFYKYQRDFYSDAEGPCSIVIIDRKSYDKFKPYSRDLAAEMMNY